MKSAIIFKSRNQQVAQENCPPKIETDPNPKPPPITHLSPDPPHLKTSTKICSVSEFVSPCPTVQNQNQVVGFAALNSCVIAGSSLYHAAPEA